MEKIKYITIQPQIYHIIKGEKIISAFLFLSNCLHFNNSFTENRAA
jgi:hypothetical protein